MHPGLEPYPRDLTSTERQLVDWVLPEDAPGYAPFRAFVASAMVIGQGRRGEGEIILGTPGDEPDLSSPLSAVASFGVAAAGGDEVSVTVREILDGQMSVEIVGRRSDRVAPDATIERRWTYAAWRPGLPCPQCSRPAREVQVTATASGAAGKTGDTRQDGVTLAICPADRRIWVRDGASGICRPVPVTNYYNELMIHKQVRDPAVALASARLFEGLAGHADADLAAAFVRYNRLRAKVGIPAGGAAAPPRRTLFAGLGRLAASVFNIRKTSRR